LTYLFLILKYFLLGRPCDEHGDYIPSDTPPQQARHARADPEDWTPYRERIEFETAQFLYCQEQMSAGNINILLDLWAATLLKHDEPPPFADAADMYETIDSTPLGDIPWQSFPVTYDASGDAPPPDSGPQIPQWKYTPYEVWFRDPRLVVRNMVDNPNYKDGFDTTPIRVFDGDHRQYENFMSGDWAWDEAVRFHFCCNLRVSQF
jgi:Plavaka transposase